MCIWLIPRSEPTKETRRYKNSKNLSHILTPLLLGIELMIIKPRNELGCDTFQTA